jgi:hypothetical protein
MSEPNRNTAGFEKSLRSGEASRKTKRDARLSTFLLRLERLRCQNLDTFSVYLLLTATSLRERNIEYCPILSSAFLTMQDGGGAKDDVTKAIAIAYCRR